MAKKTKQNIFKESIKYIKENKKYIYSIILLFFLGAIVSFIFPESFTFLNELLEQLKGKTEGLDNIGLILFIFQNNVISSFLGLFLGIFLGIFPIFTAAFNGIILGYVFNLASEVGGFGVIWLLVPHGIFELPAVFISLGLGVSLGWSFVIKFFSHYWNNKNFTLLVLGIIFPIITIFAAFLIDSKLNKNFGKEFNRKFINSFRAFFLIIIPLLAIAAIIEGLLISI